MIFGCVKIKSVLTSDNLFFQAKIGSFIIWYHVLLEPILFPYTYMYVQTELNSKEYTGIHFTVIAYCIMVVFEALLLLQLPVEYQFRVCILL